MESPEEIQTLEGAPVQATRPITVGERLRLRTEAEAAAKRARWTRIGCLASPFLLIGLLVVGTSVPSEWIGIPMLIAVPTILAIMILRSIDARQQARIAKADAEAKTIGRYKFDGVTVEALDETGRVLSVDDTRPEFAYATQRRVGLPHALISDDRTIGPRHLSREELDEIDRLVKLSRSPLTLAEGFFYAWFTLHLCVNIGGILFHVWRPAMLLLLLLSAPGFYSYAEKRIRRIRLRRSLRLARQSEQAVGFEHEGHHREVLKGTRLLWTVDGVPGDLRTRWRP